MSAVGEIENSLDKRGPGARTRLRVVRVADVPGLPTAGMSGYMLSSAAELERAGHRIAFWFRDELAPWVAFGGFRRLLVPCLIAWKVIGAMVRGERYDIVEIHEPLASVYAVLARILGARMPACVVLSFGLEDRSWQARRAHEQRTPLRSRILVPLTLLWPARVGLRAASAVLVPSSADRDYLLETLKLPPARVRCAFTGVAPELFEIDRASDSAVRVLFLGTWIERKGTRELVDAWRRVAEARPDARLTLAGVVDGDRAQAQTSELERVEVIESVARDELPALLARHDAFVLPSAFEGLPLSMLEAAAAGLPCVVTAVCGNLDVFRRADPGSDGGVLIPAGDSDALYRALAELIEDAESRRLLGERARQRARVFTWARTAEETLLAYRSAIDGRGKLSRI